MRRRTFCRTALSAGVAAALPATQALAYLNAMTAVPGDIHAVTGDGNEVSIQAVVVKEFKESLEGALLFPGDERYEQARHVWNGMIDRHPAMIAVCANAGDVSKAVQFASEKNLLLAVKGGGHSFPGKSVCEKGLMIDLSRMNHVTVDADARTATAQGGALLGQLDGAALPHELITTTGVVSHTGIGGFTLGGGMGRTDRVTGFAVDNVLGATLVTADGKVRQVSDENDTDLFWGIRGGGGNFGVVTEFVYRLHPFNPTIYGGTLTYPYSQAKEVLGHWAEVNSSLPDAASVEPGFFLSPEGESVFYVSLYYTGDHGAAEKEFAKFVAATKPASSDLGLKSYQAVQTSLDEITAHGNLAYLKSGFIPELTPAAIDAIVDSYQGEHLPSTWFQHLGGASSRVEPTATAFPHRHMHSNYGIDASWQEPSESENRIAKVREIYAQVEPHMQGFYTNLNEDTMSRTQRNFGVNYERLVQIKKAYDPTNLFRLNANIDPSEA